MTFQRSSAAEWLRQLRQGERDTGPFAELRDRLVAEGVPSTALVDVKLEKVAGRDARNA